MQWVLAVGVGVIQEHYRRKSSQCVFDTNAQKPWIKISIFRRAINNRLSALQERQQNKAQTQQGLFQLISSVLRR